VLLKVIVLPVVEVTAGDRIAPDAGAVYVSAVVDRPIVEPTAKPWLAVIAIS
jgi:hypothetical protein